MFLAGGAPKLISFAGNKVVNQLFGTMMGLGMSAVSFDWNQISWIGSPLMVPWWAEVHIFIGFVLFWWIILPILYYKDVRSSFPLYSPCSHSGSLVLAPRSPANG
jgi:hypothetical protein